jgi:DNA-binding SARP family transcriptional activator
MQAYLAKGNRPQAIKTYQNCVHVLEEEFGIDPLPETKKLIREIEEIS